LQRVLTTVTLLGLLVATAAAFAITEHLKLIRSPVFGTLVTKVFSPVCNCASDTAAIRIKLRHADRVTVTIVDSGHKKVATVRPAGVHMAVRRPRSFAWNGRTSEGTLAPDGVYYPWVHLEHANRTFKFTNRIVLDSTTPKVLSATGAKPVLFAGPGRTVAIHYAFTEQANPVVYLGSQQIIRGRPTRERDKVKWAGKLADGRPLSAGTYVLSVAARDAAGNETPASGRKQVRVVLRYIEVAPRRVVARAGKRFHVSVKTFARRYTWRLGRRHGSGRARVLHLRAPTTPGTYRLVVAEHGNTSTALVRVRAK
jgi:flagellar hook assembly protein FlgD